MSWRRPMALFAWFTGTILWLYDSRRDKSSIEQDIESGHNGSPYTAEASYETPSKEQIGPGTHKLQSDMVESRIVPLYLPECVDEVIGFGSSSFIGRLDDKTVLKYPRVPGEQWERLVIEERMYNILGSHPRIITCFGLDERGLKLEYAIMGTVRNLLRRSDSAGSSSLRNRLRWCRQAAEALAYIHTKNVIHCDISTRNFLLDKNLDLKLSDFQGLYIDPHGVTLNGFALENCKSFLPRPSDHSDQKSDLFALGTAIYEIMTGDEPFPDLDDIDDEEEIEKRYIEGQFPVLNDVLGGQIIYKCWSLAYENVEECVEDFNALEECQIIESQPFEFSS